MAMRTMEPSTKDPDGRGRVDVGFEFFLLLGTSEEASLGKALLEAWGFGVAALPLGVAILASSTFRGGFRSRRAADQAPALTDPRLTPPRGRAAPARFCPAKPRPRPVSPRLAPPRRPPPILAREAGDADCRCGWKGLRLEVRFPCGIFFSENFNLEQYVNCICYFETCLGTSRAWLASEFATVLPWNSGPHLYLVLHCDFLLRCPHQLPFSKEHKRVAIGSVPVV